MNLKSRGATTCVQTHTSSLQGDVMPSTHHGILIQVVFSTKQRLRLLHPDWRDELFAILGKHKIEFYKRYVFDEEIVA